MKPENPSRIQRFVDRSKEFDKLPRTYESIYASTIKHGQKAKAAIFFDEDLRTRSYDYRELDRRVELVARRLAGLLPSEGKGGIIALKMRNCPNWPIFFWAILRSGHEALLIDARLAEENTENLLSQTGAKALIAIEESAYKTPLLRPNDIINAKEGKLPEKWGDYVYFCSSGTTGAAKIVGMSGRNMTYQIQSAQTLPSTNSHIMHPEKIRILAMIPFHHIFGFVAVFLWYSYYGKAIVYPDSMGTKDLLYAIKKTKVTHLYSVPLFWDGVAQKVRRSFELRGEEKAAKLKAFIDKEEKKGLKDAILTSVLKRKSLGDSVEWCISGGGYLQHQTQSLINGLGYRLANGYGMTECGIISVEAAEDAATRLKGAVGVPLSGYKAKLDNGELLIAGGAVHDREIIGGEMRDTSLEDGYFRTGDAGEIREDGRIRIKGRLKDTIISSNGENVYPDEIETHFSDLPSVQNLCVFGHESLGKEEIILVLDVKNDADEDMLGTLKEEIAKRNESLPSEKKVARAYIYHTSLPISGSMKIKRLALKKDLDLCPTHFLPLSKRDEKATHTFEGYDEKEVREVLSKIREAFAKTLFLPAFKIDDDAIWDRDLGGDSMSYISLIAELNETFKVEIPEELYGQIGTVAGFGEVVLALLHPKGNGKKGIE